MSTSLPTGLPANENNDTTSTGGRMERGEGVGHETHVQKIALQTHDTNKSCYNDCTLMTGDHCYFWSQSCDYYTS